MKVAIYARVSTDDKEQNPERQLLKGRQYCELHSHDIIGEFSEFISGDTAPYTRPAFSELMAKKPKGIIVYSIDRLSRQHPNKIMLLLSQFKNQGITLISVTEPLFNMESDFSELMQYFLTWWNNYFLKKLKRDIKSGIDRARKEGKQIGRPKSKFNQYRAYNLLVNEKKTLTEVAIELNTSRTTLHRFKKVVEKNPNLFNNGGDISKTSDIGTELINHE